MKRVFQLLILSLLAACSGDFIGQYPVDDTPPGAVKNAVVTNFPGGSEISYELPGDDDLLYVKAQYTLPSGKKYEERASFFLNSMKVKGFGKSQKTTLKLIAVDRSENESAPLTVEIEPEDSPIYNILSSVQTFTSWGGLKIKWENLQAENIVVGLITKTDDGEISALENFYTAEISPVKAVRGMDTVLVNVGVFIRDRFDNYTDTVYSMHKPFFEKELDITKFKGLPQSALFPLHATFGSKDMKVLWDKAITPDANVYYIAPGANKYPYLTMDLGVRAKLSRFIFWSRQPWIFQLHSPKHFEIWGTDNTAYTAPDNWEGWIKMLDQEAYRPSGLPPGAAPTADDIAYAAAGEEYEFDISNPPVRYIRFRAIETWGASTGLNLSEIRFYGAEQ